MKNAIKQALKKGLVSIVLASSLMSARPADMPHGRAEISTFDNHAVLDTKVSYQISKKFSAFGRAITTLDYTTDKSTPFAFVDLEYNIAKNVNAIYETQFIDLSNGTLIQPRLGLETFGSLAKDLNYFACLTANIPTERDPVQNGELVATLTYSPKLSTKSNLYALVNAETVTNFGGNGLNFSSQKFRLGLGKGNFQAGFALDLSQTASTSNKTMPGVFAAYKF